MYGHNLNIHRLLLKKVVAAFPYLLLAVAILGLIVIYKFFGSEVAGKSLVYVIPVILAAFILLIRNRNQESFISTSILSRLSFLPSLLVNILLFIITVIILLYVPTRPWLYFIIISFISGSIFIQILCKRPVWTDYLIIFEIVLLSLNMIWSVTLKYPLYIGGTDVLGHIYYINSILQTAHITELAEYYNFPLFHIYNAIGVQLTGLTIRNSLFIFMGIAWEAGILFAYLIFLKFSNSRRFSLTACLLYATSSQIILFGMYAITRALGFVLIFCWLYLILDKDNIKYVILSFIMMLTVILTHHTTILLFIPVLLIVYISQQLFPGDKKDKSGISFIPIVLLTICFFAYLFYVATAFTSLIVARQFNSIFETDPLQTNVLVGGTYYNYLLIGDIYSSLTILFSLIGIAIAIKSYLRDNSNPNSIRIGFACLFFLIVDIFGATNIIPLGKQLLLWRIPLLVSPFLIYIVAYGLNPFINFELTVKHNILKWHIGTPILSVAFVIMLTFFSMLSPSNADDLTYVQKTASRDTNYFINSDLVAFSFIGQSCNYNSILYGDYQTKRNQYYLYAFKDRRVLTSGDISYIDKGYLVFRYAELQRSGGLTFSLDKNGDNLYRYRVTPSNSQTNILDNLSVQDCIYSNGSVQIYVINNTKNSAS